MVCLKLSIVVLASLIGLGSSLYVKNDAIGIPNLSNPGIINGNEIPITKAPFVGYIKCFGSYINTATIIAQQYVLTFSHNIPMEKKCVLMTGSADNTQGTSTDVSEFYYKIEHDKSRFPLAVLKLKSNLQLNEKTQIINMTDTTPSPKSIIQVFGWGVTSETSPPSQKLRTKTASVVDSKTCLNTTLAAFCSDPVFSFGDFGGPAVQNGKAVGMMFEAVAQFRGLERNNPPFYGPYNLYIDLSDKSVKAFINSVITTTA